MNNVDDSKKSIFYKPTIEYDKNYFTEGNTIKNDLTNNNLDDLDNENEDTLKDIIDSIRDAYSFLPQSIITLIENPLNIIAQIVDELPSDIPYPSDTGDNIIINPLPGLDDTYPDYIFGEGDSVIDVVIDEEDNKDEDMFNEYYYDLTCVIEDYIFKLRDIMNKYLSIILKTFGKNEPKLFNKLLYIYNASTKNISDDFKHISDSIIKTQFDRNMKERLYLKMYDADNTVSHIKSCKAVMLQKARYYNINKINEKTLTDALSNKILIENRKLYKKKYKTSFTNLYKYLNSSTVLLDDCINNVILESQSKIILLEKEEEGKNLW